MEPNLTIAKKRGFLPLLLFHGLYYFRWQLAVSLLPAAPAPGIKISSLQPKITKGLSNYMCWLLNEFTPWLIF